jgi:hypothetical protein
MSRAIKALGANRIGEYGVLWGNDQQRDLVNEYFTAKTAELTAVFDAMSRVPALYQHALDGQLKTQVVGQIDVMQMDDIGVWVEAQLNSSSRYVDAIRQLVADGKLHWSSGTLPGARKVAQDGHILRWPIVEMSLTPTPAEFRMVERPIGEIKAAYEALGLHLQAAGEGAEDARRAKAGLGLLALLELVTRS